MEAIHFHCSLIILWEDRFGAEPHFLIFKMRRFLRLQSTKSALSERFEQILDQKISTVYKSALDKEPSLNVDTEILDQILTAKTNSQLQDATFKKKHQKEIAYVQSEGRLMLQSERRDADPYFNQPWSGTERVEDTARRMIVDSLPKAKSFNTKQPNIRSKVVSITERIENAKELSLDYKVGKVMTPEEKERQEFQQMYKERLLGPSMFLNSASSSSTIGLITSMADARINAEIDQKTGTFNSDDMHSVRGKPLDKERLANSADTAYFMNELLKKQDCLPTWIESQQSVDGEIKAFRSTIYDLALKNAIELIEVNKTNASEDHKPDYLMYEKAILKQKIIERILLNQKDYLTSKVTDINSKIRSYNLQSPSSSLHKWKLIQEKELLAGVEKLLDNLNEELKKAKADKLVKRQDNLNNGFLGVFGGSYSIQANMFHKRVSQKPKEPMRFWHLVKMIFKG